TTPSDRCERKADWALLRFSPESCVTLPEGLLSVPAVPSDAPVEAPSLLIDLLSAASLERFSLLSLESAASRPAVPSDAPVDDEPLSGSPLSDFAVLPAFSRDPSRS